MSKLIIGRRAGAIALFIVLSLMAAVNLAPVSYASTAITRPPVDTTTFHDPAGLGYHDPADVGCCEND